MNESNTIYMRLLQFPLMSRRYIFILMTLLLGACTNLEQNSPDIALGQSVYDVSCAPCHGLQGEGQPNWKKRDQNSKWPAPPHDNTGHTWHHPDSVLLQIIAEGGTPDSNMPGYEGQLTQEEMEATLAYIKTFWGQQERDFQKHMTRQHEAQH
ncbi:cytochrome c [Chloroflexi bacterium TSY]|nr:cytochrome c [Chloroflexi bacterium TSY]